MAESFAEFKSFLDGKLKERGVNLKKLSELSGVHITHLEHLVHGTVEQLPAAPYVRGYLEKIARILEFDPNPWWQALQDEGVMKRSGREDALPKNRFAPRSIARYAWAATLLTLLLVYFGFRFSNILGQPTLDIFVPRQALTTVATAALTTAGAVKNASGLAVNGELIPFDAEGRWNKTIVLQPGLNTLEFTAKKFLGSETKALRQVYYEPGAAAPTSTPQ